MTEIGRVVTREQDVVSGVIRTYHLKVVYGNASCEALETTITHNLGTTPIDYRVQQLSSAYIGTLAIGVVNASQMTVSTNVSGSFFRYWVMG